MVRTRDYDEWVFVRLITTIPHARHSFIRKVIRYPCGHELAMKVGLGERAMAPSLAPDFSTSSRAVLSVSQVFGV